MCGRELTFVTKHQSYSEKPVLAASLALHRGIEPLQPIYEQKGEQDDILSNLRRGQNGRHPLLETGRRDRIRTKLWQRSRQTWRIMHLL